MKHYSSFFNTRILAAATIVTAAWMIIQTGRTQSRDPFDKSNEAKLDLSSILKQTAPIVSPAAGTPEQTKKDESHQPKEAPKDPKKAKEVIDFEVTVAPEKVRRGETVHVMVIGMPRKGWYTYAMTQKTLDQAVSTFAYFPKPGLQPIGPINESEPVFESLAELGTFYKHKTRFSWEFDILVQPDAKPGLTDFPFDVQIQVCSNSCIPGDIPLLAQFTILPDDPVTLSAALKDRANQKFPGKEKRHVSTAEKGPDDPSAATSPWIAKNHKASMDRVLSQILPYTSHDQGIGLFDFILAGMFWGFVSLITPCVFPMIPITVSFFLKQSEKEHHKPVTMALVYCGTIVVVLTIAAAALLNFFKLLSINPYMNFGLGLLFIVFALSFFGMYDIELPSFLARYTSERESKGGMIGTIFMALTFTIISFACVAPFLGGFGGTAATATARPWWHAVLGGLAFSVTFAAPFFILALFPTLLRAVPKSGAWLNSVKVVMGFLELAAAFKFFRAGELVWSSTPSLFTFDLVLGLWIAICLLCGLYLLGTYRLPHDSPVEHLSVPRLLFSFAFIGLGFYLMPALFSPQVGDGPQRPNGGIFAWVNSFLLPDSRPQQGEAWTGNLEYAIEKARDERRKTNQPKLIFVDVTGKTCTNCKINENTVFPKAEFKKLFESYILVQLYTDIVPPEFYSPEERAKIASDPSRPIHDGEDVNFSFQNAAFNDSKLPLYVILEPLLDNTVRIVDIYTEGKINDESAFAEFLRKPLKAAGNTLASR